MLVPCHLAIHQLMSCFLCPFRSRGPGLQPLPSYECAAKPGVVRISDHVYKIVISIRVKCSLHKALYEMDMELCAMRHLCPNTCWENRWVIIIEGRYNERRQLLMVTGWPTCWLSFHSCKSLSGSSEQRWACGFVGQSQ